MIHQFKQNGYAIVMDINSGAVHVMDEPAYDLVKQIVDTNPGEKADGLILPQKIEASLLKQMQDKHPDISEQEWMEIYDEIWNLNQEQALFSGDSYESRLHRLQHNSVIKALCLHVSHDCNLACKYCFAGEGEYHGPRELMSVKTGKAALDFLVANSGHRENLEVDFFGGEPLLNLSMVKEVVAYGRSLEKTHKKRFRFTLTTNGLLLDDDFADFADRELYNVVLSLDGRKEVHDAMRPTRNGSSSYDLIVQKCKDFVQKRKDKQYYIRGTYTRNNLDFAADVLHMLELGFDRVSVEPVVADQTEPYALKKEDIPKLCEQYDVLAKDMAKRMEEKKPYTFFHFMIDLEGGPCVYKRMKGCGSGTEYLAVTPNGDLYPCHQFAGEEAFRLGSLSEGITQRKLQDEFASCNVYSRKECRECFAKFYCSGGCAANSWHENKNLQSTYTIGCELERKRVECSIMLEVHRQVLMEEKGEC